MADIESNIRFGVDTTDAMASIKTLQAQISAFQRQMSSSSVANAESARRLRRGLLDDLNATGQFSTSIRTIKSSSESFTNALEKNKLSMGEYFRFAGGATQKFGKLFTSEFNTIEKVARERVKDLQTQYISLGRDANGALKAISVRPLKLDMNDLGTVTAMAAQKQQIFNQLLTQGSTNLLNFGKNTQWAGRQLMVGFTIPLSIFGSLASKTFMELEEQAIRFKRVYGELFTPPGEADEMLETLKELGKEFTKYGVAVQKTLGLAADAAAMGKTGTELLDQVTEANRLAVLGNVEQAQALETTISVTNAFGVATEDLAKKIDFLNAVENQTVVSIEDMTTAIPKAGPVVKQLGGDVEDLAFFLTAMKEGGINASEGANALKSGLASLINPTGVASTMMKTFGINLQELNMANRGDVKGLVIDFAKALDELDPLQRAQAIEQLFGKFQFSRLSTLFQNVIQEGNQASRVLEIANSTTQELAQLSQKELSAVEQSTTFRFKKAIEEFRVAIAPVGEEFLKLITPIIEFANGIIEKFNGLSDGAKSFITGLTVLLGAVGPVALMTFGLLANGVANIIKGFTFVRDIFLKTGNQSNILGQQFDYMTTEQLNAAAVAASLDQTHQQLIQTFSLEAGAVQNLASVYKQAFNEQQRFDTGRRIAQGAGLRLASGILSVPGPRGAGDIVPAVLSPGEAVIPADAAKKYAPIIQGMIAGNLPGFNKGVMLGMPRSGKSTGKNREAAEQVYEMFLQSSYRDTPPTNYGHQIAPTSGHSFPIFGLGGVYMGPGGEKVFVKPVMDEKAALAEIRGTQIARQAHGLNAPEQRIVVMRDPQDVTGTRRFLALESKLDSTFINNDPMALFNEEQYFKQLVASLLRVDKDLSADNMFRNVVADVGPAGVFNRASGVRDYQSQLPSMEDQAMINLLGIKGGAKRAFAESTIGLMAGLTPQQYHQRMIGEIQQVLPMLKQTVAGFNLTNPAEVDAYQAMIKRLEQGLSTDWSKFHAIHSAVKPSAPKQTNKIPGYANGVVSVPGPKGAGDVVPAMLSPGEAVVPADKARRYAPLIQAMISGNIPGFEDGLLGAANIKYQKEAQAFPDLSDAIGAAAKEIMASSKELTQSQALKELEAQLKPLIKMIRTTVEFNKDRGASGTSNSGVNAAHGNARKILSPAEANQAGQGMIAKGFSGGTAQALASATAPVQAYSNLTFPMPRAFNSGDMSGLDGADWVKKFPDRFVSMIAKNAKIDPNSPGLIEFANNVSNALEDVGATAVSESMFEEIIGQQIEQLAEGAAKKALTEARDTYQTFNVIRPGSSEPRREAAQVGTGINAQGDVLEGSQQRSYRAGVFRKLLKEFNNDANIFVLQVATGLSDSIKKGLGINSPSKEYENISQSVAAGVRKGQPDAQKAGEALAEATTIGTKIGKNRVTTNPDLIAASQAQKNSGKKRGRVTSPQTSLGTAAVGSVDEVTGEFVQSVRQVSESNITVSRATQAISDKMNRLNSVVMNGTFALTSLAGVGALAGGAIGEVSQTIFAFSGVVFSLMSVVQQLTQAKVAELVATRISIAKNAAFGSAVGPKTLAQSATGFTGILSKIGTFMLKLLSPIGLIVAGLTILAGVVGLIIKAQEDQKKKITGLGDTAFLTAEKMKKAGELLGFEPKTVSFSERISSGSAASRDSEERTKIETLRGSEDFKSSFKSEIDAIKNASVSDAETALAAVAAQLAASGADQDTVDAYVRALAQEAGKTDLNLSFAKIDFTKEGSAEISANAKEAASSFSKLFSEQVVFRTKRDMDTDTANPFDTKVVKTSDLGSQTEELKKSAELFAGVQASAFVSLASGLENGLIGVEEFNLGLGQVTSNLEGLSADQLALVLPSLYEKMELTETMNAIPNVSDQLLVLQATAAGVKIDPAELAALENSNKKDIDSQRLASRVRQKLASQTKVQAKAQADLNQQKADEALINEQISGAGVALAEQIVQLENQSKAYSVLIENGYSAGDAFKYAGDAGLAAGLAAAAGIAKATGNVEELNRLLDLIKQVGIAESKAPKSTTSGGAGDKSPYQQAIEDLQQQRKEILNSSAAFSKLRKAGLDTASAMEIAEDPITAAAVATTKVGTEKWNKLIKAIKTTQALLSKKEIQDLLRGGKIDKADKVSQIAVSNALGRLGWTAEQIDEALSDQEFTNTLAKDLEDGKVNSQDLLNRLIQIKEMGKLDVALNFTTKEGAAEEFQKKYDKVVGYLEARKQTVEIDFQAKTFDDSVIARKAEEDIALRQFAIDNYEAELVNIDEQEEKINSTYEDRKKALDDISRVNDEIAKQQKSQLTLADALSQGDIAAAARAAQEMRSQNADSQVAKRGDLLELSKERELANVRTKDGRSRKQVEEDIKILKKEIFDIEEDRLEPARENIRLAEVEKSKKLDSLNQQILRWDVLSAKVNEAKLKLTPEEMSAMEYQAGLIANLLENWDKIEDKSATLTIVKKTVDDAINNVGKPDSAATSGQPNVGGSGNTPSTIATSDAQTSLQVFNESKTNVAGFIKKLDSAVVNAFDPIANALANATKAEIAAGKDLQGRLVADIERNMNPVETARQVSVAAGKEIQNRIISGIQANMATTKPAVTKPTINTTTLKGILEASRPTNASVLQGKGIKLAMGGMVKRYATGGFAMGTDIIPAMLTPGEFVVRKYAVDNFGTDKLKAINNGTYKGDSMYNYEVNVNVQTGADPDKIARSVIGQIKQIDSQRIRGNRL